MISELYLKRAFSIRKEYLKIRSDIERYELIAKDLLNSLESRKSDFEKILEDLKSNKFNSPDSAKNMILEVVLKTEEDMNRVDKSVNDLNKRIDQLKEDEINLYKELKRTYTDLSDEQIKKCVQEYIINQKF
jgi:uncharacterized protein YdiU (UPF0061 family)